MFKIKNRVIAFAIYVGLIYKLTDMKKNIILIFIFCSVITVNAQINQTKFKFDICASPYSLSLNTSNINSISFYFSSGYMVTQNISLKLCVRESVLLSNDNTYDYKDGFGLGLGYYIYRGKKETLWEKTKFETVFKVYTMFSDIKETNYLLYDFALRMYFAKMPYFATGLKFQKFDNMNILNLYFSFGIRI